jgi:PAS domain S-box-containing protein
MWLACGMSCELRAQRAPLPELTTAAQVRQLTPEQAEQHYPVKLRGVVTLFDQRSPGASFRFVQDATAGIYLFLGDLTNGLPLAAGELVAIEGVSGKGEFAPIVIMRKCEVLGEGSFPRPKAVSLDELATGREDSQFVEFTGIVRSVQTDEETHYQVVDVAGGGGRIKAFVTQIPLGSGEELVDSTVRVRGVCVSHFNQLRQLFDVRVVVPRPEYLAVEIPAPADPFAVPTKRIEDLLQFSLEGNLGHRVKVAGTVVCRPDDSALFIEDETEGLRVETQQAGPLSPGDVVEVLGFPGKGDYTPMIQDARFHKIGTRPPMAPDEVAADGALQGTHDCRLVRIRGLVLEHARNIPEQFLALQSGGFIFHAYLASKERGSDFAYLRNGSEVAVTGVCLVEPGSAWHPGADWRAKSFRLLLRSADDIVLLKAPPWWTLRKMLWILAVLAATALLASIWVVVLRRKVHQQTDIIRQKLEAEAAIKQRYQDLFENANDMVFTHDLAGCLTSINSTGEQLLQRHRSEILGRNILDFVVEEQRGPARQWLERVGKDPDQPPAGWDFLNRSGQRVRLEISTRLVHAGATQEVEGIARDITERNRLELEILEISAREQRRIGHDLHDGVCQQLVAIAYLTDILADRLQKKGDAVAPDAEKICTLINEAIGQTRGVARGLFPVRLEENGLVSALEELAANASSLFKIQCSFSCEENLPRMENGAALHLYYIAQEAVLNAAKHSKAAHVKVALSRANDRFVLTVQDNGLGFALPVANPGLGIRIMRYRARVIGATFDLKSEPGHGTQIACAFYPAAREAGSLKQHERTT